MLISFFLQVEIRAYYMPASEELGAAITFNLLTGLRFQDN